MAAAWGVLCYAVGNGGAPQYGYWVQTWRGGQQKPLVIPGGCSQHASSAQQFLPVCPPQSPPGSEHPPGPVDGVSGWQNPYRHLWPLGQGGMPVAALQGP